MSNESAAATYQKLQDEWAAQPKNSFVPIAPRLPGQRPVAGKSVSIVPRTASPVDYKPGPIAKACGYTFLCLLAVPVAFVIYALSPFFFWFLVICLFAGLTLPTIQERAAEEIALQDEIKKQLDARA